MYCIVIHLFLIWSPRHCTSIPNIHITPRIAMQRKYKILFPLNQLLKGYKINNTKLMGKWLSFSSTSHLWNCLMKTVFELSDLPRIFSFLIALSFLFFWNLYAIFYIFFSHVCKNSFCCLSLNYIFMEHLNVYFLNLGIIFSKPIASSIL